MIIGQWERAVCRDRQVQKRLHGYWYRPAGSNTKWWTPECDMNPDTLAQIRTAEQLPETEGDHP